MKVLGHQHMEHMLSLSWLGQGSVCSQRDYSRFEPKSALCQGEGWDD